MNGILCSSPFNEPGGSKSQRQRVNHNTNGTVQVIACGEIYDIPVNSSTLCGGVIRDVLGLLYPGERGRYEGETVLFYGAVSLSPDFPLSSLPNDAILHLHFRKESTPARTQPDSALSLPRWSTPKQGSLYSTGKRDSVYGNRQVQEPSSSFKQSYGNRVSDPDGRNDVIFHGDREPPSWGAVGCTYVPLQSTEDFEN